MSPAPRRVLIDDQGVCAAHRAVLERSLRSARRAGVEVVWASRLGLEPPPAWEVAPAAALPLVARLWTLLRPASEGVTLHLEGHLLPRGDLTALLDLEPRPALAAAGGPDLRRLRVFLSDHAAIDRGLRERLEEAAAGPYERAAEFQEWPRREPLPASWAPVLAGQDPAACLVDLGPLDQRPWCSPFAPAGAEWVRLLLSALEEGEASPEAVRGDVKEGRARPSLLHQLEHRLEDASTLPATLLDLDRSFVPPEAALTTEELRRVRSRALIAHTARLRLRNSARIKGKRLTLARRVREEVGLRLWALWGLRRRLGF